MSSTPWRDIPFQAKLLQNVTETALRKNSAALENAFIDEQGAAIRFPGLRSFVTLPGAAPTYLHEWRGDLIAVSNGRMRRISPDGSQTDITGVPVSGGRRVVFTRTDDELVAAAGAEIVRFAGEKTELLSPDAPLSTHVAFIDSFLIAVEVDSGRFSHSEASEYRTWDPIDTFVANAKPDNISSLVITPYREIIVAGLDSIEQFERLPAGGTTPFFRRWASGEGLHAAYTLVGDVTGTWYINRKYELTRASGQTGTSQGDAAGRTLESITDWTDAWSAVVNIVGQKFLLVNMPRARNVYDTEGVTLVFDIRQRRFTQLFGWDADLGVPALWPGSSYYPLWGRHFVGGRGVVYEMDADTTANGDGIQRVLGRTAHFDDFGECEILNARVRVKRGAGSNSGPEPQIGLRAKLDNKRWTRWRYQGLGRQGDTHMVLEFGPMGQAHTWQFEWACTDDVKFELHKMQAQVRPIGF